MNHGILKQTILFSSAILLVLGFVVLTGSARAAAASSDATNYCMGQTATKAACEQGYDGGTGQPPAQSVTGACSSYPANSSDLDACQSAWGAAAHIDKAVYGCGTSQCDFIAKYINPAINLFSLVFGLVAVISIILGGIQYSASQGDPQKAAAAKSRISNTIIAIFAYIFLYAFLQFLIPGGAFH